MAAETVGASAPDSLEALKRVKATENEWDARLNGARRNVDETLTRLRSEAAAAVKEAQTEAGRDRVERVVKARAETEAEAEAILAEGKKAAEQARLGEGRRPADKKDALLDIVLGSFGKD